MNAPHRTCAWCHAPLRPGARSDAVTCSRRCRQARHRFRADVARLEAARRPLRLGYADPPYPGLAHYYSDHPDYRGEVDHRALLSHLEQFDGWALHTSADALHEVQDLAHDLGLEPRVGVWVCGSRPRTTDLRPRRAWEAVLYCPARRVPGVWPDDVFVHTSRPRMTDAQRVIGAKPAAVISWVFGLIGARAGDELDDLFPGSGGVSRAWHAATASDVVGG